MKLLLQIDRFRMEMEVPDADEPRALEMIAAFVELFRREGFSAGCDRLADKDFTDRLAELPGVTVSGGSHQ